MHQCNYCKIKKQTAKSLTSHLGICSKYKEFLNKILTKEFLETEYLEKGKSIPDISKQTGFSYATIHRRLVKLQISRSSSQAAKMPRKKKKSEVTHFKRYGTRHNFCKNSNSRKKWEAEMLKNEKITNVFQRESVKQKIKASLLEKYGVENPGSITTSRGKNSYSQIHREVVQALLARKINCKIEKKIPKPNGYYWSFDIYIEPNILVEVNGDYWHGNPNIYNGNDIILKGSSRELLVKSRWEQDAKKLRAAEKAGFKTIIIWESDWKTDSNKQIQRIIDETNKNQINQKDSPAK